MNALKILALGLAAAVVSPVAASAQPWYNYPGQGYFHYAGRQLTGRVVAVNGSSFQLASGRVVFMHQGTVINPVGRPIRPGQRVMVRGRGAGNGNIDANVVNIMSYRGY
jgi:hypothetical protein